MQDICKSKWYFQRSKIAESTLYVSTSSNMSVKNGHFEQSKVQGNPWLEFNILTCIYKL